MTLKLLAAAAAITALMAGPATARVYHHHHYHHYYRGVGPVGAAAGIAGAAIGTAGAIAAAPFGGGPYGGVVTQRSAKPCTPVQFWSWPPA